MARIIAALMLFVPGIISAFGIKLMRDTLFDDFHPIFFHVVVQFFAGFVLFIIGIGFIGGFIVHRDRKRQLIKNKNKKRD
ncbi:DUF2627 family protein [Virgibacillus sp. C22-A2]|uniref:DUF2627 family protein n=1 Tax=Virgibacillus tibetensis TaxID=3042313 RepID=A0ABU6KBW2_9BACI|nr:DUF2627 family protein [Virgibacillus sp. C22-A2]